MLLAKGSKNSKIRQRKTGDGRVGWLIAMLSWQCNIAKQGMADNQSHGCLLHCVCAAAGWNRCPSPVAAHQQKAHQGEKAHISSSQVLAD